MEPHSPPTEFPGVELEKNFVFFIAKQPSAFMRLPLSDPEKGLFKEPRPINRFLPVFPLQYRVAPPDKVFFLRKTLFFSTQKLLLEQGRKVKLTSTY